MISNKIKIIGKRPGEKIHEIIIPDMKIKIFKKFMVPNIYQKIENILVVKMIKLAIKNSIKLLNNF